jgi:hypothetical protein
MFNLTQIKIHYLKFELDPKNFSNGCISASFLKENTLSRCPPRPGTGEAILTIQSIYFKNATTKIILDLAEGYGGDIVLLGRVLGKLGPGKLGPGKLGPGKLGPGQLGPIRHFFRADSWAP